MKTLRKKLKEFLVKLDEISTQRAKVYQTIRELSALSDYELNDIGINRGMIRSVAEEKVQ